MYYDAQYAAAAVEKYMYIERKRVKSKRKSHVLIKTSIHTSNANQTPADTHTRAATAKTSLCVSRTEQEKKLFIFHTIVKHPKYNSCPFLSNPYRHETSIFFFSHTHTWLVRAHTNSARTKH